MTPARSILILALVSTLNVAAADWPQWRGPTRDGRVPEGSAPWPERLTAENFRKLWSVDLAEGYASPIVVGNRVFTVETRAKKDEIVRAFDRKTGKQLWETAWAGSMKVIFIAAKNGSWVRSTPACDGESVFVGGMRDVLVALDATTGRERWRVDFPAREETPLPSFGFVCSPMLDDKHVYVQVGTALRKVRKSDGHTVWKALQDDRAMFGSAFSSPARATIGGRDQILAQSRTTLAGVAPKDGKVLWSTPVKAFRGMNILTPTVIGDHVFTATYGGGLFYFGVETAKGSQTVTPRWNHKTEGYMSSPVVIGDKVYHHGRDKRFHCIDPAKGRILWSTKKTFGKYWSMVTNKDRLLALDEEGILRLVAADPAGFQLVDELEVSGRPTWAHLAVCGDEIYVRDLKGLTAYRWR